jgi:hypothetical protein
MYNMQSGRPVTKQVCQCLVPAQLEDAKNVSLHNTGPPFSIGNMISGRRAASAASNWSSRLQNLISTLRRLYPRFQRSIQIRPAMELLLPPLRPHLRR